MNSTTEAAPAFHSSRRGKVTKSALPLEYSLSRFIEKVENPHSSWKADNRACEWKGVKCDFGGHLLCLACG